MYGMVTKAVKELIVVNYGEATWDRIMQRAGVDVDVFISNDPYPDSITFQLIGAAAEILDTPVEQILEQFGRHWILYTGQEGYGDLLKASGRTLPDFLVNLPNLHTRICMIFPELEPPSFSVTDRTEQSLHLHYRTHRAGLTHFVIGLLDGLGTMFDTAVTTRLLEAKAEGADHDVFLIEWTPEPES